MLQTFQFELQRENLKQVVKKYFFFLYLILVPLLSCYVITETAYAKGNG